MKVLIDLATIELATLLRIREPTIRASIDAELASTMWREVERPSRKYVLAEDEAEKYLSECIGYLERKALPLAGRFTSAQWLWLLRRVPLELFNNRSPHSAIYRRQVAELLSAQGGQNWQCTESQPSGDQPVELGSSTVDATLELVVTSVLIGRMHAMYRMCGKGAKLRLQPEGIPDLDVPDIVKEAVDRYEVRRSRSHRIDVSGRAGTQLINEATLESEWPLMSVAPLVQPENVHLALPEYRPDPHGRADSHAIIQAKWRWLPLDLDMITRLPTTRSASWWKDEFAYVAILMHAALLLALEPGGGYWPTLLRVGYVCGNRRTFQSMLERVIERSRPRIEELLPGATIEATHVVIDRLLALGHTWPTTPGPPLRFSEETVYIDIAACTQWLDDLSPFAPSSRDGELLDLQGRHFEHVVQLAIDDSVWRPGTKLAPVRGRHLRLNGQTITDIDAIGEHGRQLILVSAKGYAFTNEYLRGAHTRIRNVQSELIAEVKRWRKKISRIANNPVGNNYDLSGYDKFIPVVITPFPPFVTDSSLNEETAPDLAIVSALSEFDDWLQRRLNQGT